MNGNNHTIDEHVLSAVSDSLSQLPVAPSPRPEAIMAKGRARRHRRRASALTAALAVVAAGAGTAATLSGASHPAGSNPARSNLAGSHTPGPAATVRLDAWSVSQQANGDIRVTVKELNDPAGLQRALRADGVPASVTFLAQPNTACSPYPHGTDASLLARIFPPSGTVRHLAGGPNVGTGGQGLVIDPAAIPATAGLQLAWSRVGDIIVGRQDLVRRSSQCTGS